jgi:hypothetical protein
VDDVDRRTRTRLVRARDDARGTIRRGITLVGLIPVVCVVAALTALVFGPVGVFALMVAAAYAFVGGIGGLATIAAGVTGHRKATRELRAFDAPRQLPMARLVQR